MRIINRDLTRERIVAYITNNQIYIKIWYKTHGKWVSEFYFQSYDWEIDSEMVNSTIEYVKRTWGLKNPKVIVN